jgi:hypothetical protein
MANADNRFGLIPINKNGSVETGQVTLYYIPASDGTAVYVGDAVVKNGTANASDGVPQVIRATAGTGNALTGAVVSVQFNPTDLETTYRKASTGTYVFVADDPKQDFIIQCDGTLAVTDIGSNANVVFTHAGVNAYGTSGMELDTSSFATGATLQLKVKRLHNVEQNEIGAFAKAVVQINNHTEAPNKAGI